MERVKDDRKTRVSNLKLVSNPHGIVFVNGESSNAFVGFARFYQIFLHVRTHIVSTCIFTLRSYIQCACTLVYALSTIEKERKRERSYFSLLFILLFDGIF